MGKVVLLVSLVLGVAVVAIAFVLVRAEVDRPSVPELVAIASGPMPDDPRTATAREIDGLGFPDWKPYGCRAAGGRLDQLEDDREAATVSYLCGAEQVTYTIVSGTGNVDDETITIARQLTVPGAKVEIALAQTGGFATLKRKREGRTILMTGRSPNEQLVRKMRRLAVRGTAARPE